MSTRIRGRVHRPRHLLCHLHRIVDPPDGGERLPHHARRRLRAARRRPVLERANNLGAALAVILGLAAWILFELFVPEGDIEPQLYGLAASALGMLVGGLLGPKAHHRPHMGGQHAAAGTYHTHR